jgi:hypothetical protein
MLRSAQSKGLAKRSEATFVRDFRGDRAGCNRQ